MYLRRYKSEDKQIVAEMNTELSMIHVDFLKKKVEREQVYQEILEGIEEYNTGKHKLFVGIENERIIGYVILDYRGPQVCWIDELFVVEEERNKGYGTEMVNQVKKMILEEGYEALSIDVVPRNTDAIRLYQRLGFDALSILTLRQELKETYRDKECEVLGLKFKY